ncbi:MAG TPA: MarR family transcriptional regulator [Stenotrophomonas sp.]
MSAKTATLGTLLRHLVELLDGAVEEGYQQAGLDYRSRYTPVVRTLLRLGPSTVRAISNEAGLTHSAASQTVAQMGRQGLVKVRSGKDDARERIVELTEKAKKIVPALESCWAATAQAADSLEKDLGVPLSKVLREAIESLEQRSFAERLAQARRKAAKR